MKSEKGVSLVSLIIYLIAMTITVGIVARISNYFYRNIINTVQGAIKTIIIKYFLIILNLLI